MKHNGEIVWRKINGYPMYEVSNRGHVRSYWSYHIHGEPFVLSLSSDNHGYKVVSLKRRSGSKEYGKRLRVHRMVADAFIPNPDARPEVNHINNIPSDNRVENLEWATHKENMDHAVRVGAMINKTRYKYSPEDILSLRADWESGRFKQKDLVEKYGMPKPTVSNIVNRKSWQHI